MQRSPNPSAKRGREPTRQHLSVSPHRQRREGKQGRHAPEEEGAGGNKQDEVKEKRIRKERVKTEDPKPGRARLGAARGRLFTREIYWAGAPPPLLPSTTSSLHNFFPPQLLPSTTPHTSYSVCNHSNLSTSYPQPWRRHKMSDTSSLSALTDDEVSLPPPPDFGTIATFVKGAATCVKGAAGHHNDASVQLSDAAECLNDIAEHIERCNNLPAVVGYQAVLDAIKQLDTKMETKMSKIEADIKTSKDSLQENLGEMEDRLVKRISAE